MDLVEQMKTFVRIVETGSLSAAARGRKLSLAAVSRQLSALEADLNATLVVRSTRRLHVTPTGQRWHAHCARLLRELDDARADVADSPEPRGTVVISAPVTLGLVHVAPRLERLARRYPHVACELRLEDHVVDLVADAVDIAVRAGVMPPDSAGVIAHPLVEFRRFAVASPAYLRRRGVPRHPRELANHDGLIQLTPHDRLTSWTFERAGERCEGRPRTHLQSTAPIVLREWARAGAGIAFLGSWLADDTLRMLFPEWSSPPLRAWALHRVELRGAPRIRAVLEALAR
jgi:DNA-binding transcriptional LysR family regulator